MFIGSLDRRFAPVCNAVCHPGEGLSGVLRGDIEVTSLVTSCVFLFNDTLCRTRNLRKRAK